MATGSRSAIGYLPEWVARLVRTAYDRRPPKESAIRRQRSKQFPLERLEYWSRGTCLPLEMKPTLSDKAAVRRTRGVSRVHFLAITSSGSSRKAVGPLAAICFAVVRFLHWRP